MNQALIDAIQDRQVICFYYENLLREVEPHIYGRNAKGEDILWGFQTAGQSKSGRVPCWRQFEVAHIQHLYLAGRVFPGPRPGFPDQAPELDPVYARLAGT